MKNRRKVTAGVSAAIAAGALLVPLTGAYAGHTNTLLTRSCGGHNEVAADGARRAGDPNGHGKVYVFGVDGDPTTSCATS